MFPLLRATVLASLMGAAVVATVVTATAVAATVVTATVAAGSSVVAAERPNVLFIAIDDLRCELGCYGVETVKSPHIDALAASGVTFTRAYCQQAVCNPSRASLLTGLRPDHTRVWDLVTDFRSTIPDAVTLPQHFKQQGYTALGYGKIFHNTFPDNPSWSEPHGWPKARLWSEEAQQALKEEQSRLRTEGLPEAKVARLRSLATEKVDLSDSEHVDGAIADQALAAMRRLKQDDQPFFLAAGFIRPHLPFVVPQKYWDLYDPQEIPLAHQDSLPEGAPEMAFGDRSMGGLYELRDYFDHREVPSPFEGPLTEAQQRHLKHGYYASVSFIDAQVGRLLEELDRLELADNTIVVLWSDHGWKLGEHNGWCKQTNYEIDTRTPVIVRAPGVEANGQRSDALVELVDLYPTLCDLAGIPVPDLDGVSWRPLLESRSTVVKELALSQFPRRHQGKEYMGYALRSENHRYVEWRTKSDGAVAARELYDHRHDPGERRNLVADPEADSVLKRLSQKLAEAFDFDLWRKAAGKDVAQERPSLRIENAGSIPMEVFWIPDQGEPRSNGSIAPGDHRRIRTTLGHRFEIRAGDRLLRTVVAREAEETVRLSPSKPAGTEAPNVLVIVGDDWSWPHASFLGDKAVQTPAFDRIAREGVLFENAFTVAPSCTPSRHAISSGQHHWRLGEGVDLGGSLPANVPVYPDLLAGSGYHTGFARKGASPSQQHLRGSDPFGDRYDNLRSFLDAKGDETPFCFWYGAGEPHRPFEWQSSQRTKRDLTAIQVPPFLPDNDVTRTDLGDYYRKVEQLDRLAGGMLDLLEQRGELENTIVIMTGDNGMAFPRAKATLYDAGTRVPLAVRWGRGVPGGVRRSEMVSLIDLAPTLLEACGLPIPTEMTGRSLLRLMTPDAAAVAERSEVLTGMERHVYPYPSRALRSADFLYIENQQPAKWPNGSDASAPSHIDFATTPWPTFPGAFDFNIDPSPSKQWMRQNRDTLSPAQARAFTPPPAVELYRLANDPHQLRNLAETPRFRGEKTRLRQLLLARRIASQDPGVHLPEFDQRSILGWTVLFSKDLETDVIETAERILRIQLDRVVQVLPPRASGFLKRVPIWVTPPVPGFRPTAEYHPNGDWLADNKRDPRMAKSVQISNADQLESENRRMPMLMLHELAHAYHDQVLGFDHGGVAAAFKAAEDAGIYDRVERRFADGRTRFERAYAMSNAKEYFAEATEAYFGENDWFPYNVEELREHDPRALQLMQEIWGEAVGPDDEVTAPPGDAGIPDFYSQYITANGYPIVGSPNVSPYALKEAAYLANLMLAERPDIREAMIESGSRLCIIAHNEFTTDLPEFAHLEVPPQFRPLSNRDYWDARARGTGGSRYDPYCSCGEENLLGYPGDPYAAESIFIHEFAHNMHLRGLLRVDPTFDPRLEKAYQAAMKAGLWKGKYASVNSREYFAEGVQSWFDDNRENDHDHNHVNTRAELIEYDPALAELCREVFGETELRYTKPATRLQGHLAGYDPSQAPTFTWPKRLLEAKRRIREAAENR